MLRPRWFYLGLIVAAVAQTIYLYPQLPDTVSSHYDVRGDANDWTSKQGLFMIYWLMLALMVAIFAGIPRLMSRLPNSLINLPNKQYWLAPERREQTLRTVATQMHWFGVAVLAMLVAVFHMAFSANLPGSSGFPSTLFNVIFGSFFLFVAVWMVRMLLAYRIPRT